MQKVMNLINSKTSSPGKTLRSLWEYAQKLPMGNAVFSKLLGSFIPYTGNMGAVVETLENGFVRVRLKDKPSVRNHLGSIHAIALANLAELSTGLCLNYSLPENARAILVKFSIEYHAKARGKIHAETKLAPVTTTDKKEYKVTATLYNEKGSSVASATAHWLVDALPTEGRVERA